jgi:hypothetical protein
MGAKITVLTVGSRGDRKKIGGYNTPAVAIAAAAARNQYIRASKFYLILIHE